MIRRVVAVKFKEGTSPEQVQEYVETVRKFPGQVSAIVHLTTGPHVSDGDDSVAFSHVSLFDFEDLEGVRAFLTHPAHLAAAHGLFRQIIGQRVVVNYELHSDG